MIDWGCTTPYLKTAHGSLTSFQTEYVNTNSNLRFQVIFHLTCRELGAPVSTIVRLAFAGFVIKAKVLLNAINEWRVLNTILKLARRQIIFRILRIWQIYFKDPSDNI